MTLAEELQWRGFVHQMTFEKIDDVNSPRTLYFGVDPSADSMTIGNLASAMMVRHFIDHGYKAILLVGGATGMIGDPDGKKQERTLNSLNDIEKNKAAIAKQYETVFAGQTFEVVDNYDWFKNISYLDFLRDIGKYTSMTQMLDREFVQSRIGQGGSGISYAEFSYSLIQGYDYLHLHRQHGATLQVCGADQWGNSITGVQLIRKLEGAQAHVYSTPLIVNKSTGVKFGKSEGGAVWLDPQKTSPYKFYQFWLNLDDEGVIDYLKIYTLLDHEQILQLEESVRSEPHKREAQKTLAYEVTRHIHGDERAISAQKVTETLFGDVQFADLSFSEIDMLKQEIPSIHATTLFDALIESHQVKSVGEARRLVENGGIKINGDKVTDDKIIEGTALVKKGKNNFFLVDNSAQS